MFEQFDFVLNDVYCAVTEKVKTQKIKTFEPSKKDKVRMAELVFLNSDEVRLATYWRQVQFERSIGGTACREVTREQVIAARTGLHIPLVVIK